MRPRGAEPAAGSAPAESADQVTGAPPIFRPMAEHGLLVQFGDRVDPQTHAAVVQLDKRLAAAPPAGFLEAVPTAISLLICFDPLRTDHDALRRAVGALLRQPASATKQGTLREVRICYDPDLAPDLAQVARMSGLSPEAVIAAHLGGDYSVYMYGFAPGYAYLDGVPKAIQTPRKAAPVRAVPAGSVLIAGPQCLVSTLTMPTGWWIIGRSPTRILTGSADRPFLFDVGDRVRFRRISRSQLDRPAG